FPGAQFCHTCGERVHGNAEAVARGAPLVNSIASEVSGIGITDAKPPEALPEESNCRTPGGSCPPEGASRRRARASGLLVGGIVLATTIAVYVSPPLMGAGGWWAASSGVRRGSLTNDQYNTLLGDWSDKLSSAVNVISEAYSHGV